MAWVFFESLGAPRVLAIALGMGALAAGFRALRDHLPATLDGCFRTHRIASALWVVIALASFAQTARLSVFMLDPTQASCSVTPWSPFMTNHSCATAYVEAARVVRDVPNVYESSIYRPTPAGRSLGRFKVDNFEYPPPFLVLPRAALAISNDFLRLRAAWFAVEGLVVLVALFALGRFIGGREGLACALLVPLVWLSLPTQLTLQMGNVQLAAVAVSILAMIAFERDHPIVGGTLLALAILTKIFPAILLLHLAFQKRWRAVGITALAGAGIVVVGLVVLGSTPYAAFVHHQLPRLSSGDAFPMLKGLPWAVAINHSIYGIPLKLRLLGIDGAGFGAAAILAWVYTLALVPICFLARPRETPRGVATTWLALLGLAALRSPFLPQEYAVFVPLCVLLLVAAKGHWTVGRIAWLVAGFLVLSLNVPLEARVSLRLLVLLVAVPQIVGIGLLMTALFTRAAARATAQ